MYLYLLNQLDIYALKNTLFQIESVTDFPLKVHTYIHITQISGLYVGKYLHTYLVFTRHFLNMNKIQIGRFLQVFYNNVHLSIIYIYILIKKIRV